MAFQAENSAPSSGLEISEELHVWQVSQVHPMDPLSASNPETGETQIDKLCKTCLLLLDKNAKWEISFYSSNDRFIDEGPGYRTEGCRSYQTIGELSEAAESGCHLCTVLMPSMRESVKSENELFLVPNNAPNTEGLQGAADETSLRRLPSEIMLLVHLSQWFGAAMTNNDSYRLLLFAKLGEREVALLAEREMYPNDSMPESYLPSDSTGSKTTLKAIKDWLSVCRRQHKLCKTRPRSKKFGLPTRLISLHDIDYDGTITIIDSEAEELPDETNYMTLSHRWGPDPPLKLTAETETSLRGYFPLDQMPKLFQDVMKLVVELRCRYLWVDTLCIRQDDPEDWLREVTRMGDVYAGSSLNISASRAMHTESLYSKRDVQLCTDLVIKPSWTCFPDKILYMPINPSGDPLRGEPLLSRGWVSQERTLSPRVLHFGTSEVVWECMESANRELSPKDMLFSNLYGTQKNIITASQDKDKYSMPRRALNLWRTILDTYSTTETTFEADRLLALAGLASISAKAFEHLLGRYYAGLWNYGFVTQLAWRAIHSTSRTELPLRKPFPTKYRAPSWSWASLNCPISTNFNDGTSRELAHMARIDVQPENSEYGPAINGSVQLWGNLCEIRVLPKSTKLHGDAIQLLPEVQDAKTADLNEELETPMTICSERKLGALNIYLETSRAEPRDTFQEIQASNFIIEADTVTVSNQGVHFDDPPSYSTETLKDQTSFLFPVRLQTQKLSVWIDELSVIYPSTSTDSLSKDSVSKAKVLRDLDPRDPGPTGYTQYFLTDPRLRVPLGPEEERKVRKHYDYKIMSSHSIEALILEPVKGSRGVYKRVGLVCLDSMAYGEVGRRQRVERNIAKILADGMSRGELEEDRWLEKGEQNGVYLIEII